jgi:hypothetical protein
MDFSTIRPAIKALISSLSGLNAEWEESQRPFLDPATMAIVLLKARPVASKGTRDSVVEEFDATRPQGEEFQEVTLGSRTLVVSVKVESWDQRDAFVAHGYAERVRNRLSWASSRAALREVNVSLAKCQTIQDLDRTEDNRRISVAVLDLLLNVHVREVDTANRYGYIQTVELEADIRGTQGNP